MNAPDPLRSNGFRWGLVLCIAIAAMAVVCCGWLAVATFGDMLRIAVRFGESDS